MNNQDQNPNQPGPSLIHQIVINLVSHPSGGVGIVCNSSADPIMTLGLMEAAKDVVKEQYKPPQSPLVVAKGQLPRMS